MKKNKGQSIFFEPLATEIKYVFPGKLLYLESYPVENFFILTVITTVPIYIPPFRLLKYILSLNEKVWIPLVYGQTIKTPRK